MDTKDYRQLLVQVRDLLIGAGDRRWGPRLQAWLSEFDAANDDSSILDHVRRTRRAIAGMGSISDVIICRESGHVVPDDDAKVSALNERLQTLTDLLHATTVRLLNE